MRFSTFEATATALLAGVAVADPLAVINPCPAATSTTIKPITVTKQYQEVSTCATATACFRGSCVTRHPFETFAYVSTVIPAAWDGKSASKTTVTSTTQVVTVSRFQSTITKWVTPAVVTKSGTTTKPSPTPIYLTIAKDFFAPYNKIGPLAIPGYGGSGLCKDCGKQEDGSRSQIVDVVECRAGPGGSKCMGYAETWISKPAPSTSATTVQPVSTRFVAPSAGTYVFTFPFWAPAKTITAETTTITVGPVPYFAKVTRVCHRAREVVDITTTITKTIYWTAPCSRQAPTSSSAVPLPTGKHSFPGWPRPRPQDNDNDSVGGDAFSWADWGSDDAANPSAPIPKNWADWVATNTKTVTDTLTISPTYPTTSPVGVTTTSSFSQGPIDATTSSSSSFSFATTTSSSSSSFSQGPIEATTSSSSSFATTTSSASSSFSQGPIEGSTTSTFTTSGADSTTTSSSFSFTQGPIDGSTTSSFTSTSSFTQGPIEGTTTTSSSSFSFTQGPIDGSTTSTFTSTSVDVTTSTFSTTSSESTTSSSFSSVGPIEPTSSTSSSSFSTTSADSTTTSFDSTTTSADSTTTSFASTTTSVDSTTTSADSTTTTTITSFTSTSATTTSAFTTTTSLAAIPVDPDNFVIGVNSNSKYHKRAFNYIRFDGEDAVLTPFKAEAARFQLRPDGLLTSNGLFVDADPTQAYLAFSLSVSINSNTATFSISLSGVLSIDRPNQGFCVTAANEVFIIFSSNPPFVCVAVTLAAEVPDTSATSTTSALPTPTTSATPTATTSLDPSADLDADVPAPTNVRRGVQYGGRKFSHRRH